MNKAHIDINWENYPSDETPLNERNLNKMDGSIDIIDDRVIALDTTKATKAEVATLVADVTFEESTGIITITKRTGPRLRSIRRWRRSRSTSIINRLHSRLF